MIICLLYAFFLIFFLILNSVLVFNPEKLRERLPHNVTFLDVRSTCFPSLVSCLQFTLRNVAAKAGNDVSLLLKDSDMD